MAAWFRTAAEFVLWATSLAQLRGANDLGQRLSDAASQGGAHPLTAHQSDKSVHKLLATFDPQKDGKHDGSVNGQEAKKAEDRNLTDPAEAFAQPVVVLDTSSTAAWAMEAGNASFSGQNTAFTSQGDNHETAAHTRASVSGKTTSWSTHEGGAKAYRCAAAERQRRQALPGPGTIAPRESTGSEQQMRAVFGVVALLVVLAIVGLMASRQLKAVNTSVSSAGGAQVLPGSASTPAGNLREQSQQLQQRVADDVAKAMAQGARKDESGQ